VCVSITLSVILHSNIILYALCYVVVWGLHVCTRLFPHILTKGIIFENINWIRNMHFFLWYSEIFLIPWTIQWYTLMNIYRFFYIVTVILVIFAWNGVSQQIFENFQIEISWKYVSWESSCSMWTQRHDKASSRFSQFCEKRQKILMRKNKINLDFFKLPN